MRVFVAGATGAIGQYLVPMLIAAGHEVTGSTRSPARASRLSRAGARPVVLDGLDRPAVIAAVEAAQPDVIVHQMTALASLRNFRRFDADFAVTNELRTKGTDYLLEAARQVGTRRFIAQSFTGWTNGRTAGPGRPGGPAGPAAAAEDEPLDPDPLPSTARTLAALRHVEEAVPGGAPEGVVLRYGMFYGPGTSPAMLETVRKRKLPVVGGGTGIWSFVEVSDAAAATALAVSRGAPGLYNIVDDDPAPVSVWLPYLCSCLQAKPPVQVPGWLGKLLAGEVAVALMTQTRGAANAKARTELGWVPRYPSWREGFAAWTATRPETHADAA
jgi:nucleoside-diphosphate-sugar epimerase